MKCNVKIDDKLLEIYSDIRLGLLQFKAEVKESNIEFWEYMNHKVQPQIKNKIEGKEWNDISGVRGSRVAYKAFGRNSGRYRVSSEALLRRVRRGDDLYHVNSVLADNEGIFGSSMSDSTRAMVTAQADFQKFADIQNIEAWVI